MKKRILLIFSVLILIAAACILISRLLNGIERRQDAEILSGSDTYVYENESSKLVRYDGKWYRENPDITKLLLIGVDKEKFGEEAKQSDFLLLLAVDTGDGSAKALHINRDTMTDVPQLDMSGSEYDTKKQQIALAYSHGSSEDINSRNTVKAVENLLYDIDIQHYITLSMDAVAVANDLVGGVPVFVEDDFSNIDPALKQGEIITLNGKQALVFVRSRGEMDDKTNLARMNRQRVFLDSFRKQAAEKLASDSDFVIDSLLELAQYITSDCTVSRLSEFFNTISSKDTMEIQTPKGTAKYEGEYVEFYLDEEDLKKEVIDIFFIEADEDDY